MFNTKLFNQTPILKPAAQYFNVNTTTFVESYGSFALGVKPKSTEFLTVHYLSKAYYFSTPDTINFIHSLDTVKSMAGVSISKITFTHLSYLASAYPSLIAKSIRFLKSINYPKSKSQSQITTINYQTSVQESLNIIHSVVSKLSHTTRTYLTFGSLFSQARFNFFTQIMKGRVKWLPLLDLNVANLGVTELAQPLLSTQNQMVVSDSSVFPQPPYRLTIMDENNIEIVEVTGTSGNQLTITRGVENTLPRTWRAGTKVKLAWTAGMFDLIKKYINNIEINVNNLGG